MITKLFKVAGQRDVDVETASFSNSLSNYMTPCRSACQALGTSPNSQVTDLQGTRKERRKGDTQVPRHVKQLLKLGLRAQLFRETLGNGVYYKVAGTDFPCQSLQLILLYVGRKDTLAKCGECSSA